MKVGIFFAASAAAVGLSGCLTVPLAENAVQLNVNFEWSAKSGCGTTSPEIVVSNVPSGTRYLKVNMSDLDKPTYSHGGGEVEYSGQGRIEEGALKSYIGPCPPGGSHRYEFVVRALNAEKSVTLGEGKAMRRFPE